MFVECDKNGECLSAVKFTILGEEMFMKVETRLFGEIDIEEEKIITFDSGIVGFPDLKSFSLIYDLDKEGGGMISWLQSMDEGAFALPVINPVSVDAGYNPMFDEEVLNALGTFDDNNAILLTTITVPPDLEKMSVNLKAPIVINTDTRKAAQIIVDDDYPVKKFIYELLKENKKKNEDKAGD